MPRWRKSWGPIPGTTKAPRPRLTPYAPYKSGWEKDFAAICEAWKQQGAISTWLYEKMSFEVIPKSAHQKGVRYIPDFVLFLPDGRMRIYEVKGHWRPGAKAKVKSLRAVLPATVLINVARKERGIWTMEPF